MENAIEAKNLVKEFGAITAVNGVSFAVGFFFSSLSMAVTSLARNFDFFTYYFQLFISPMFFFSGIFFPLGTFPKAVQWIAAFLPLTHAVAISKAIIAGQITSDLILRFALLIIQGAVFFLLALRGMKRRLIK